MQFAPPPPQNRGALPPPVFSIKICVLTQKNKPPVWAADFIWGKRLFFLFDAEDGEAQKGDATDEFLEEKSAEKAAEENEDIDGQRRQSRVLCQKIRAGGERQIVEDVQTVAALCHKGGQRRASVIPLIRAAEDRKAGAISVRNGGNTVVDRVFRVVIAEMRIEIHTREGDRQNAQGDPPTADFFDDLIVREYEIAEEKGRCINAETVDDDDRGVENKTRRVHGQDKR